MNRINVAPLYSDLVPFVTLWGTGLVLLFGLMHFVRLGQFNLVFALIVGAPFLLFLVRQKSIAILGTFAYLYLLGDIRRVFDVVSGLPAFDLLLLIGPMVAVILSVPLFLKLQLGDTLSKAMLYLTVIMLLEIFNPKQGGITVGFAGAMFYLIPVLWFWIGRQYSSQALLYRLIYRVLLPLAIVAALLGLYQQYVGFLPWEQAWIDVVRSSYVVLDIGGATRSFGFSVSAAEYLVLLQMGSAVCFASWLAGRAKWLLPLPLLLVVLFLGASRGSILKLVIALGVVVAMRKGRTLNFTQMVRFVAFAVIGILATTFTASTFSGLIVGGSAGVAVARQLGGLAHPFDTRYSTAHVHQQLILGAVLTGTKYPIGYGLGATTHSSSKFGAGSDAISSEFDMSDAFVNLGLPGGLLYLFIVYMVLRYVFRYATYAPRHIGLPILVIIVTNLGSWLIYGQYSTSAMLFFLIGAVVREENLAKSRKAQQIKVMAGTLTRNTSVDLVTA